MLIGSAVVSRVVKDDHLGPRDIPVATENAHHLRPRKRKEPIPEEIEGLLAEPKLGPEGIEEPLPLHGRCDQDYTIRPTVLKGSERDDCTE